MYWESIADLLPPASPPIILTTVLLSSPSGQNSMNSLLLEESYIKSPMSQRKVIRLSPNTLRNQSIALVLVALAILYLRLNCSIGFTLVNGMEQRVFYGVDSYPVATLRINLKTLVSGSMM